jgi:hypothetical protein
MSPSRYELSELQWEKIKDFLSGRKEHVGRTAADNRPFVNGVLWILRSARAGVSRRRQGHYLPWHRMRRLIARWLPTASICHPYCKSVSESRPKAGAGCGSAACLDRWRGMSDHGPYSDCGKVILYIYTCI